MEGTNGVIAPPAPPDMARPAGRLVAGSDAAGRSLLSLLLPLVIAAAFFGVMMPIGAHLILHYPDERHYAYAGARMVETGNWLVPETPRGAVRLKKPVVPYWFSAAGFEVLGVGVPGFRLFWVVAASGILLLTYAMARVLGASRPVALLAELMMAANPVFFRAATNSIPDIPLSLFVAAAALGFVGILAARDGRSHEGWAWLGWIATALGVLTKGALPVVLAATLIAYVALFDRARLAAILRPLPIAVAAVLVAAWYGYAAAEYPKELAEQFFGDQMNVTKGGATIPAALAAYAVLGPVLFLAWPFILIALAVKARSKLSPAAWPSPVRLLALWCVVVAIVFAFAIRIDPRYLLPVGPAMAVLLALGIAALDGDGLPTTARICRWLILPVALLGLALLVPEAAILAQVGTPLAILLLALGALAWLAIVAVSWRRPRAAPYLFAPTPLLMAALVFLALAPVVLPDRGEVFAGRLAADAVPPSQAAFVGDIHTASEIRLHAGKASPFLEAPSLTDELIDSHCTIMTTERDIANRLAERGFAVSEVKGGWRDDIEVGALFEALVSGTLAKARVENGAVGYYARCSVGANPG